LPEEEKSGDEYLFEIGTFLISSAKGCLQEPKLYGPLRLLTAFSKIALLPDYAPCLKLLTAFSKIALLPDYAPCLKRDEFLLKLREEIDEKIIPLLDSDPEKFEQLIKDLGIKLAKEIKKRKMK